MKFVILAAGRGSRVGRAGHKLHKALLPLNGRAILSHQLELAPNHADIIIVVGNRSTQVRDYVRLAHPSMAHRISFVEVEHWAGPKSGPGSSLLCAKDLVGIDDMVYASCDTLWTDDPGIWDTDSSWAAVAPVPAGSMANQWCRFTTNNDIITGMLDKTIDLVPSHAFTGLALIKAKNISVFWHDIESSIRNDGEVRDVAGFTSLIENRALRAMHIEWTDTGTEHSYRSAVARYSGYDWTKLDQATYVLPQESRVVKFMADEDQINHRYSRGIELSHAVPSYVSRAPNMLSYTYIDGQSVYDAIAQRDNDVKITEKLLTWYDEHLTRAVSYESINDVNELAYNFYHVKTKARIKMLDWPCNSQASDAISSVDWNKLVAGCVPVHGHGDFNFGNIICTNDESFVGIDWREDFSGAPWIDMRYDLAKLLAGTMVHWDNARRGDFRPWTDGAIHNECIREFIRYKFPTDYQQVEIIAALSLINSAPLHASPLDEILVARATFWLGQIV